MVLQSTSEALRSKLDTTATVVWEPHSDNKAENGCEGFQSVF